MSVRMWSGRNWDADTGPEHYRETWVGAVLATVEHNYHDDSDFAAIVWDAAKGEPREVEYATTRFSTYRNSATVDATDEVRAAYAAWKAERARKAAEDAAAIEAEVPRVGRHVKVVKGRKVPLGTEGTVFWYGVDRYARTSYRAFDDGRFGYRVGFKTDGGDKWFTSATNVEVAEMASVGSE